MSVNFDKFFDVGCEAHEDDFQLWLVENKDEIEREKLRIHMIQTEIENKEFDRINKLRVSLGALKLRR
ncbi:hypothetical protein ACI51W_03625 [Pseudomonas marginalis]|uniref:hypothetical protein n=1 Tax=Pseudomonas marginalis TaxID=298 RepID=UPI0038662D79